MSVLLANGRLAVELDQFGRVSSLSFPHVSREVQNHRAVHRLGVWVDGEFSWIDDGSWRVTLRLPQGALVAHTVLKHERLGLVLECDDFVDSKVNVFGRNIHVVNLRTETRQVRLFLHQAFRLYDDGQAIDTAQYVEASRALLHYRGRRAFAAGLRTFAGRDFDRWTVGRFGDGLDGAWRDAEDGELAGCPHEYGMTDSVLGCSLRLAALASDRCTYWLAAGTSIKEALGLHEKTRSVGLVRSLARTTDFWHKWLSPGFRAAQKLPLPHRKAFINSLLTLRAHVDEHGLILTDGSAGNCRLHDAAFALWPLIRLGYGDEAAMFFEACRRIFETDGYFAPAYYTDGEPVATDTAWRQDRPPMRLRDAAAVLFIFCQFATSRVGMERSRQLYQSVAAKVAIFLTDNWDNPAVDDDAAFVWQLSRAALEQASELAQQHDDPANAVQWRTCADDISTQLAGRGADEVTMDAVYAAYMFGVESEAYQTKQLVSEATRTLAAVDGLFKRRADDPDSSVVASLWLAQYYIETGELARAERIVDLIRERRIAKTGVVNEYSASSVVASAEYVNTLLDMIVAQR
jgi:similar to glucoamylase